MNAVTEELKQSREEREAWLVDRAVSDLASVFDILKNLGFSSRLARLHETHIEQARAFLRGRPGLCKLVSGFVLPAANVVSSYNDVLDPVIISNLCQLLAHLAEEYPASLNGNEALIAQHGLRRALRLGVGALVQAVNDQAERLAETRNRMVQIVAGLRSPVSRVVLLEFPIGNSVPVRLVERRLQSEGYEVAMLRISLSRNDKAGDGVKRSVLLSEGFASFLFREGDVLLYPDAWCSGANFKNLCEFTVKVVKRLPVRVTFIPFGLLSPVAHEDPRFGQFLGKHGVLVAQAAVVDDDCVVVFPPLKTRFSDPERLFWSESDRMAEYRKMQLLGSLFSSLDAAAKTLHEDEAALVLAGTGGDEGRSG